MDLACKLGDSRPGLSSDLLAFLFIFVLYVPQLASRLSFPNRPPSYPGSLLVPAYGESNVMSDAGSRGYADAEQLTALASHLTKYE